MVNINQLPYFQTKNNKETNRLARFVLKKVKKILQEKMPYHYLIFSRQDKRLAYIRKMSKKYKYFLKIDVEKYYPSINHKILLDNVWKLNFQTLGISRKMRSLFKYEIPEFLKQSPTNNRGLALGNYLGWVLASLYLLPLDLKISRPFLRVQDDYLIFCKNRKEPQKILKEIVEPELEKLELKLNINKLNSGKFHQNPVEFLGFKYYAGIFTISEKKIEEFKDKITKITHLTKKKPSKAIIKLLNNKILGFGHYYKFASAKKEFEELDGFIRMRLRRYIARNKDSKSKEGNLMLTNAILKEMGLKSLIDIKEKYDRKKRHIFSKKTKGSRKNGKLKKSDFHRKSDFWIENYGQKAILKQLQEITKNIIQIKNKVDKIEKKWKVNE